LSSVTQLHHAADNITFS